MAMMRSGKAERLPQLRAPISHSPSNWILWKPSVDPVQLYRDALRSFNIKRRLKIITVFAPIPLLFIAAVLIDLRLMLIPAELWFGIVLGLVLLAPRVLRKWEDVERRNRVGRFDEFAWIDSLAGSQCITKHTAHTAPAAHRIVTSLATISDSRALADGWIDRGDVRQLHEIAWESLTENHALNYMAQSQLLDETAAMLEQMATETNRLDVELRDLEKKAELEVLKQKFQDRQFRVQQISADLEARLRFLEEQDRKG